MTDTLTVTVNAEVQITWHPLPTSTRADKKLLSRQGNFKFVEVRVFPLPSNPDCVISNLMESKNG